MLVNWYHREDPSIDGLPFSVFWIWSYKLNLSDIESGIVDVYKQVTGNIETEDFSQLPLNTLGLDSLDIIDFVYHVEDKFNIKLQFEDQMLNKLNLHELSLIVHQKIKP